MRAKSRAAGLSIVTSGGECSCACAESSHRYLTNYAVFPWRPESFPPYFLRAKLLPASVQLCHFGTPEMGHFKETVLAIFQETSFSFGLSERRIITEAAPGAPSPGRGDGGPE